MSRVLKILLAFPLGMIVASCTYTFYPTSCEYPTPGALKRTTFLSGEVNETSGLVATDGTFITFNDSGGEAALYELDKKGSVVKKSIIANTMNADWEDIAFDGSNYYIADVGNNFGNRDTLVIYKIPLVSVGTSTTGYASDSITFSYDEQISRSETGWYSHDCEAIFVYRDSIYLFAKDWVTQNTRVYVLSTEAGHYKIKSRISYQVDALITGADLDAKRHEVVLVGYRNYIPVLIRYGFNEDPAIIECGGKARKYPRYIGTQTEGVCYDKDGFIYVSSEKSLHKQSLYRAY